MKTMSAVSVIFAMTYFSLAGSILKGDALSITVFTYSMICMLSFLNISYIRDFDALQVNMVPIILALAATYELRTQQNGFCLIGMAVTLYADSYFAIRYQESNDMIDYNNVEKFAQYSWTSQYFNKMNQTSVQLLGMTVIFAQIFLTLVGTIDGSLYQALFLSFYLTRLVSFMFETLKGVEMYQSNMVCLIFAIMSTQVGYGENAFATAQSVLMLIDAYMGLMMFVI